MDAQTVAELTARLINEVQKKRHRYDQLNRWKKHQLRRHLYQIDDEDAFTSDILSTMTKAGLISEICDIEHDGMIDPLIDQLEDAGVDVEKLLHVQRWGAIA